MTGVLVLLLVFGLVALLLGSSRWLAGRPWAALGNAAIGIALLAVVAGLWPASRHLRAYDRIPAGGVAAQVHCERTGPGTWRLTLTRLPQGRMEVFEVEGDQWRLDARTLAWKGKAAQLGLPALFRFDRLSARRLHGGTLTAAGPVRLPGGYALAGADAQDDDPWLEARAGHAWADFVHAGLRYGPWQPLEDGARYEVRLAHVPGTEEVRLDAQAIGYTRPRPGPVRAPRN